MSQTLLLLAPELNIAKWLSWAAFAGTGGRATLAAANYLCRASGDMTTEAGWRAGIAAYNSADSYLRAVALAADNYR